MKLLIVWLVNTVALLGVAYLMPSVHIDSFGTALVAALVLGLANAVIRPILVLLTLPVTILTLGLFIFVVNALCVLLVASLVPGFHTGFMQALIATIVLSIVNLFWKMATTAPRQE